jgi:hypothetical protein
MLSRYRWYRIRLPSSDVAFREALLKDSFAQDAYSGFLEVGKGGAESRFKFFFRSTFLVTRLGEDNEQIEESVDGVNVVDFALIRVKHQQFIRLENSLKGSNELFNSLELAAGRGFTVSPVTFDKEIPGSLFEHVDIKKLIAIRVAGAAVQHDVVAKMEFMSREGIVEEKLKLLRGLRYKIELSAYECTVQGVRGQVAFEANGLVRVSGQLAPLILHYIEGDLPRL